MQGPTWPGSVSLALPAVYFPAAWNPRGGGEGCKENARRGMTDGRGEAAQGRTQPSRPGLSLPTVPVSPATQARDWRGNGTIHCAERAGEEIGGAIHLDRRGEAEAANLSWELRDCLFSPCGSSDPRVPFPGLDSPYFPIQASGSAKEHGV